MSIRFNGGIQSPGSILFRGFRLNDISNQEASPVVPLHKMSKQSESSAIQEITRKVQQLESLLADAIREDGATSQKVRNLNSELEGVLHILTTDFPGLVSDLLLVAEEERVLREECEAALQAIKTQWKSEISTLTATIGRLAKLDCLDTQSDDVVSLRRRIAELESECETLRGIINETTKGP